MKEPEQRAVERRVDPDDPSADPPPVDKVTALITRVASGRSELLLFEHPTAGIQIPAGTVEPGEALETAVLRELREETGITAVSPPRRLGQTVETLPSGHRLIAARTCVYARPDPASFDWASLPRGIAVQVLRQVTGYTQIEYVEHDRLPDPTFITMRIQGWVPDHVLAKQRRRTFFQLACLADTPARWTIHSDSHTFTLFWAPLAVLPPLVEPQAAWPDWLGKTR